MPRALRALPLVIAAGLAAGCVTESISPVRPVGVAAGPPRAVGQGSSQAAPGATTLSLVPLGAVRYDGVHLPIASGGGEFIVVASGLAPDDSALLAAPGARPPVGSDPRRYDLRTGRPEPVDPPGMLDGLLLGRSADDAGVTLEWPRPDGSRWIGRLPWNGGPPQWSIADDHVNAFAICPGADRMIYCRRAADAPGFALVEHRAGSERVIDSAQGESLVFPAISPDRTLLAAVRLSARGLEISVYAAGGDGWSHAFTRPLGVPASMQAAEVVFAAMEPCPSSLREGNLAGVVLARSPATGEMMVVSAEGVAPIGVPVESLSRAESVEPGAVIVAAGARVALIRLGLRDGRWTSVPMLQVAQRRLAVCGRTGQAGPWLVVAPGVESAGSRLDLARLELRLPAGKPF